METLILAGILAGLIFAFYNHGRHVGSRAGYGAALRRMRRRRSYRRRLKDNRWRHPRRS